MTEKELKASFIEYLRRAEGGVKVLPETGMPSKYARLRRPTLEATVASSGVAESATQDPFGQLNRAMMELSQMQQTLPALPPETDLL